jgi:hypothetical protein
MDQITPGMTYGLAVLAVSAYSIPLLLTAPRRLGLNKQIFGVNEQIRGRSESD